jgi:hypothetical protein
LAQDQRMTDDAPRPITAAYFYTVKWGFQEEWLELFTRNHWPLLRERLERGDFTDVRLYTPRYHGDGRADWTVMVTITYSSWEQMNAHTEQEIKARLFPDQKAYAAEEQRRFELLEAHWDVPLEEHELPGE